MGKFYVDTCVFIYTDLTEVVQFCFQYELLLVILPQDGHKIWTQVGLNFKQYTKIAISMLVERDREIYHYMTFNKLNTFNKIIITNLIHSLCICILCAIEDISVAVE